jgi:hypothetical protein
MRARRSDCDHRSITCTMKMWSISPYPYCHVITDYRRGFRLVIGFIEHLHIATTNNHSDKADTFYSSLQHALKHLSLLSRNRLSGNGFVEESMVLAEWRLSPNKYRRFYTSAYNNGESSASHNSVRGGCLSRPPTACLPTASCRLNL